MPELTRNTFGARDTLTVGGKSFYYYRLSKLEELGFKMDRLPVSIRVMLESVLRNCNGYDVTEADVKNVLGALGAFTDVSQWHFVFTSPKEIKAYYNQLKLVGELNPDFGTPNVYIVDKERNLRGRKEKKGYKEGYNTFHPADLSNEMLDDFKVILYEYRAALKKNHNATKEL